MNRLPAGDQRPPAEWVFGGEFQVLPGFICPERVFSMKSVCFFNNKGGVGKTTLACNTASFIASKLGYRVLVVDADPQCNSTQLIIKSEELERIYGARKPKMRSPAQTLFDVLQPIAQGDSSIADDIIPLLGSSNRFRVDLIPGHPRLATLEDLLSQAWVNFGGGDLGGSRKTNWNSELTMMLDRRYDLAVFDVGPSLGALNRSVLVGVDYFVSPMGCDIFSLAGIENISIWLKDWLKSYDRAISLCEDKWGDHIPEHVKRKSDGIARLAGYTVQQYITKTIRGERRATKAYETILAKIPGSITKDLKRFIKQDIDGDDLRLGDVPNMFSLVPLAQNANSPIHDLEGGDGLVGTQYTQKSSYMEFIENVAHNLLRNLGVEKRP
jgi:cellulose biosynthesis protein BcsQ